MLAYASLCVRVYIKPLVGLLPDTGLTGALRQYTTIDALLLHRLAKAIVPASTRKSHIASSLFAAFPGLPIGISLYVVALARAVPFTLDGFLRHRLFCPIDIVTCLLRLSATAIVAGGKYRYMQGESPYREEPA